MADDTPVTHAILREELKSAAQLFTDLKESLERQIRDIEKSPERPFRLSLQIIRTLAAKQRRTHPLSFL